jgi:hypothetical protein
MQVCHGNFQERGQQIQKMYEGRSWSPHTCVGTVNAFTMQQLSIAWNDPTARDDTSDRKSKLQPHGKKYRLMGWAWWYIPVISTLGR